jgi:hypothetical protein
MVSVGNHAEFFEQARGIVDSTAAQRLMPDT